MYIKSLLILYGTIKMSKELSAELKEMHGDIRTLIVHMENVRDWTKTHQESDVKAFEYINKRINGLFYFASAIGTIAFVIGKYVEL